MHFNIITSPLLPNYIQAFQADPVTGTAQMPRIVEDPSAPQGHRIEPMMVNRQNYERVQSEFSRLEQAVLEHCGEKRFEFLGDGNAVLLHQDVYDRNRHCVELVSDHPISSLSRRIRCLKQWGNIEYQTQSDYYQTAMNLTSEPHRNNNPRYYFHFVDIGVLGLRRYLRLNEDESLRGITTALYREFGFPATARDSSDLTLGLIGYWNIPEDRDLIDVDQSFINENDYWIEITTFAERVVDGVRESVFVEIQEAADTNPARLPLLASAMNLWEATSSDRISELIAGENAAAYRALAKHLYSPGMKTLS